MSISAKSRYAVRALVELAERSATSDRPVRLTEIAASREIPPQFLEQLFAALRRAGLLRSRRGASGGFSFARPPEQVTVLDVVEALDGAPSLAVCSAESCRRSDECGAGSVWIEARRALEDVLAGTTISALVERERAARSGHAMYYI